jgi:hypothetical protein
MKRSSSLQKKRSLSFFTGDRDCNLQSNPPIHNERCPERSGSSIKLHTDDSPWFFLRALLRSNIMAGQYYLKTIDRYFDSTMEIYYLIITWPIFCEVKGNFGENIVILL